MTLLWCSWKKGFFTSMYIVYCIQLWSNVDKYFTWWWFSCIHVHKLLTNGAIFESVWYWLLWILRYLYKMHILHESNMDIGNGLQCKKCKKSEVKWIFCLFKKKIINNQGIWGGFFCDYFVSNCHCPVPDLSWLWRVTGRSTSSFQSCLLYTSPSPRD